MGSFERMPFGLHSRFISAPNPIPSTLSTVGSLVEYSAWLYRRPSLNRMAARIRHPAPLFVPVIHLVLVAPNALPRAVWQTRAEAVGAVSLLSSDGGSSAYQACRSWNVLFSSEISVCSLTPLRLSGASPFVALIAVFES